MNMLHMNVSSLDAILTGACALLAVAGAAATCVVLVSLSRCRARIVSLESRLAALRGECEPALSEGARAGARIERLEQELTAVGERMDALERRGETRVFDQAIDSARRGVDPERLTAQFGLSRGEADLVARLHGRKKTA
jgi:hypothetical protein